MGDVRDEIGAAIEYEYAVVRSDDAAKWVGRDGWEVEDTSLVRLRRAKAVDPRCAGTLGSRPWWMGVDQYDPCRCRLDAGHEPVEGGENGHWCEHLNIPDPRLSGSSEAPR